VTHLFWKDTSGTKNLLSKEFSSESEFEELILSHQELLGDDIFLITNQIRGGSKKGIPDIIGIDRDQNICIIEMKNVSVDSDIIPQVLEYALWAESNPAELKNLWLQSAEQPEEFEIDFDKLYEVRIIIVAPSIEASTALATEKINFEVDLIEIERWSDSENEFFLVKRVEPPETKRPSLVRGKQIWNEEEYLKQRNPDSVKKFIQYSNELQKISTEKNWDLDLRFNKLYSALYHGMNIVGGFEWYGTKSFGVHVNLPEEISQEFQPKNSVIHTSSKSWKNQSKYVINENFNLRDYIPVFEKALNRLKEKRKK